MTAAELVIERVLHTHGVEHAPRVVAEIVEDLRDNFWHLISDVSASTVEAGDRETYRLTAWLDGVEINATGLRSLSLLCRQRTDLRPMLNAQIGEDLLRLIGPLLRVPVRERKEPASCD